MGEKKIREWEKLISSFSFCILEYQPDYLKRSTDRGGAAQASGSIPGVGGGGGSRLGGEALTMRVEEVGDVVRVVSRESVRRGIACAQ